jgi:hypothetical protein
MNTGCPIDNDYCNVDTETSDVDYKPGRTSQLQVTERPADASETHDEHDRQHLQYDAFEASVAATGIQTYDADIDNEKWTRIQRLNAGMDKRPGRDNDKQKVDLERLDKKRKAEAVASQFGLRGKQEAKMVTWIVNNDLRGYSRHHGGRLGAACAEACYQAFESKYEALDSGWACDTIKEVTRGTKVVTEFFDEGDDIDVDTSRWTTVVTEKDDDESDDDEPDIKIEYEEKENPVEPSGLLSYHWDRRRQV